MKKIILSVLCFFVIGSSFLFARSLSAQTLPVSEIKPGWLVKNLRFAEVFYVDASKSLRWIENEPAAKKHFGDNWQGLVRLFEDLAQSGLPYGPTIKYSEAPIGQIASGYAISDIKPGWLVKNRKYAEVFYVERDMKLRWIVNEYTARTMFGSGWNQGVKEFDDLSASGLSFGPDLSLEPSPALNLTACAELYHLENGACISNRKPCTVANGTGEQVWLNNAWAACQPIFCNQGYEISGGICLKRLVSYQSDDGWNLCQLNTDCQQYHSCQNGKCVLNNTDYKLGIVYLYNSPQTYNANWRSDFTAINKKVTDAVSLLSNGKINLTIEVLGEMNTNIFCWNPSGVGGKFKSTYTNEEFYFEMPGSKFSNTGIGLTGWEITESYCPNCQTVGDIYRITCDNNLSYSNLWTTNYIQTLENQINAAFAAPENRYNGVIKIFGKLGKTLPNESEANNNFRCTTMTGEIEGYSNLMMAENSLRAGGLIACEKYSQSSYYDGMGWETIVHEILHRFGAVDIYDTGTVFGYDPTSDRDKARAADTRADQSIMGNRDLSCYAPSHYVNKEHLCSEAELNAVYLDIYNQHKIGL